MRTTLNIKDDVLRQVVKLTHATTKSRAVAAALEEYLRSRKQQEIKKLSGKIKIHLDWKKMEEEELKDSR